MKKLGEKLNELEGNFKRLAKGVRKDDKSLNEEKPFVFMTFHLFDDAFVTKFVDGDKMVVVKIVVEQRERFIEEDLKFYKQGFAGNFEEYNRNFDSAEDCKFDNIAVWLSKEAAMQEFLEEAKEFGPTAEEIENAKRVID